MKWINDKPGMQTYGKSNDPRRCSVFKHETFVLLTLYDNNPWRPQNQLQFKTTALAKAFGKAWVNEMHPKTDKCTWHPIETIPDNLSVDVWITSSANPNWGRRLTDVAKTSEHSLGWSGIPKQYLTADFKLVRWMRVHRPTDLD